MLTCVEGMVDTANPLTLLLSLCAIGLSSDTPLAAGIAVALDGRGGTSDSSGGNHVRWLLVAVVAARKGASIPLLPWYYHVSMAHI